MKLAAGILFSGLLVGSWALAQGQLNAPTRFSGGSTRMQPPSADGRGTLRTEAVASPSDPAYRLGTDDLVEIEVWNNVEVEYERRTVAVDQNGMVYLPLLKEVRVADLTVGELNDKLRRLYAEFIKNPQVFVLIGEYNSRHINVLGSVKDPGRLVLKGEMSLMEALAEAGDVTDDASDTCRVIRRTATGQDQIFDVSLSAINSGDLTQNVPLRRNDTVFVLTNLDTVYVDGYVNQPGKYDYVEGLTAQHAVILAGGLAEGNAGKRTKVYRIEADGHTKEYKVDVKKLKESFYLQPGDIIKVPASWL